MTEEEMAEKWIKDHSGLIGSYKFVKYDYDSMQQAYLAGHKADSPKWHILAEEPNILPKEGQKVRVLTEEGIIEESTLFYDTYYEELSWSNIGLLKVFAWCEIPEYTEE